MGLAEERRIAHSLEKIADCAELLTQIINDNRETINLMFKSTKKILEIDEKIMEEYGEKFFNKEDDDLPNTGFTVDEKYKL
jgi:hypothetical protein